MYVGLPETEERTQILQIQRSKMPWHENVQLEILVDATKGANAASLVALCQSAAIHAMQRCPADSTMDQVRLIPMSPISVVLGTYSLVTDAHSSLRWTTSLWRWLMAISVLKSISDRRKRRNPNDEIDSFSGLMASLWHYALNVVYVSSVFFTAGGKTNEDNSP